MNYEQWRAWRLAQNAERFWRKVDKTGDCWLWTGTRNRRGRHPYGVVAYDDTQVLVHRLAYELLIGPIPEGFVIDHLCKTTLCCNPATHMEPVTQAENVRRGESIFAQNARKTHCTHGHELAGANLRVDPKTGGRHCHACAIAASRRAQARERARRVHVSRATVNRWCQELGIEAS